MTVKFWERLRTEFAALPVGRQGAYHAQSHSSHLQAREVRKVVAASVVASSSSAATRARRDGAGTQPIEHDGRGVLATHGQHVAGEGQMFSGNLVSPICAPLALGPTGDTMAMPADGNLKLFQDSWCGVHSLRQAYEDNDRAAIVEDLVPETSLSTYIAGKAVKTIADEFQANTRKIGRSEGIPRFPDEVEYPSRCRAVCAQHAAGHRQALQLLAMLKAVAQRCHSPNRVPHAEVLLVAEASFGGVTHQSFWWLLAATSQSGHHPATQTFWRCKLREASLPCTEYGGIQLMVERAPLQKVSPPGPAPFHKQSAAPVFYSEEAMARAIVVGDDCERFNNEALSEVVLKQLLFTESVEGMLTVSAIDHHAPPIRMASFVAGSGSAARRKSKATTDPSVPDFLSLLATECRQQAGLARTTAVAPGLALSMEVAAAQGEQWDADGLADHLGLRIGAVFEDPLGDPTMLDGLCEAIGLEDINIISGVQLDLEEDDADREEQVAQSIGDPVVDYLSDGGEQGPAPPVDGGSPAYHGQPPSVASTAWGLDVVETGFQQGCLATYFLVSRAAASSSAGPPPMQKVGVLHRINAQGLKMTCKFHRQCVCWLTYRGKPHEEARSDLVQWLSRASPSNEGLGQERHSQEASALKSAYGMRLRKR